MRPESARVEAGLVRLAFPALERLARDLAARLPRARPVDRPVHDDAVKPGRERPPPVESVERADRRDERLLGDVLRRRSVVHDEIGGAMGSAPVTAKELLHRLVRTSLRRPDDGPFALSFERALIWADGAEESWQRLHPENAFCRHRRIRRIPSPASAMRTTAPTAMPAVSRPESPASTGAAVGSGSSSGS